MQMTWNTKLSQARSMTTKIYNWEVNKLCNAKSINKNDRNSQLKSIALFMCHEKKGSINQIRLPLCTSYVMTWTKTQHLLFCQHLHLNHCLISVNFLLTRYTTVEANCLDNKTVSTMIQLTVPFNHQRHKY